MDEPIEVEQVGRLRVELVYDTEPANPREEWDEGTIMVCQHSRYQLGDKREWVELGDRADPRRDSWCDCEDMEAWEEFLAEHPGTVWATLYLYDHGGITISTGAFSDPWDSGVVGVCYMTPEMILWEYGNQGKETVVTDDMIAKARALIEAEVQVYDDYLRGDVYGFRVVDEDGDVLDSCYGFYGEMGEEALAQGVSMANALMAEIEQRERKIADERNVTAIG